MFYPTLLATTTIPPNRDLVASIDFCYYGPVHSETWNVSTPILQKQFVSFGYSSGYSPHFFFFFFFFFSFFYIFGDGWLTRSRIFATRPCWLAGLKARYFWLFNDILMYGSAITKTKCV